MLYHFLEHLPATLICVCMCIEGLSMCSLFVASDRSGDCRAQVDVYSFSMILYQLFEHTPPFAGVDPVEAARQAALYDKRPNLMQLGEQKAFPMGVRVSNSLCDLVVAATESVSCVLCKYIHASRALPPKSAALRLTRVCHHLLVCTCSPLAR